MTATPLDTARDALVTLQGERAASRNSGDSSTPPGAEDLPGKKPPERAPRAAAASNTAIRALIILGRVVCGDETPLRAGPGPKTRKKYLQVACTSLLTCYFLADRDLGIGVTCLAPVPPGWSRVPVPVEPAAQGRRARAGRPRRERKPGPKEPGRNNQA